MAASIKVKITIDGKEKHLEYQVGEVGHCNLKDLNASVLKMQSETNQILTEVVEAHKAAEKGGTGKLQKNVSNSKSDSDSVADDDDEDDESDEADEPDIKRLKNS